MVQLRVILRDNQTVTFTGIITIGMISSILHLGNPPEGI